MMIPAGGRKIANKKKNPPITSQNVPLPITSKTLCNTAKITKPNTELIMRITYGFGFSQLCVNASTKSMLLIKLRIMPGGLSGILTIIAAAIDIALNDR